MLISLQDKVAWVTGAGTGIGQAGAVALAGNGAHVVLSGRREEALRETETMIAKAGGKSTLAVLDVTDEQSVQAVVERIIAREGRLDILVNNAGTNVAKRHWDVLTSEAWRQVIDIDLTGAYYCAAAVLPVMRKQKDGLIINVSSWAGRYDSYLTGPAYSAAKHGLVAMNASINIEECVNGIRACALCPGEVNTPILNNRPVPLSDETKAKMLQPDDLGETILFVAQLPKHVCINELLISPTWNRGYVNDPNRARVQG